MPTVAVTKHVSSAVATDSASPVTGTHNVEDKSLSSVAQHNDVGFI